MKNRVQRMKTRNILFYLICQGIFLATQLSAQQPLNYRYQYLGIEDGLPQNTINAIVVDSYGFMWFGTNNGISRFDGYSFESFRSDESASGSLPDNMISAIEQGEDGRLWIGSLNGLSYYDPISGHIYSYTTLKPELNSISRVTSLLAYDKHLWVSTSNSGLYLLQADTEGHYELIRHYTVENGNLPVNQVNTIYRSPSNKLLIGTSGGALAFLPKTGQFVNSIDGMVLPAQYNVTDIYETKLGDLFFGSFSGMGVIWNNTRTEQWFEHEPTNPHSVAHNTVNKIIQDASGQLLVGSLGGLQIFDSYSGKFFSFPEEGPENFKLNNQFISTLFSDNNGNVWIGTEKGGINKFNVFQNQFEFYANDPNNPNSLNENTINSILREGDDLWIGTAGGGINHLNLRSQRFTHYTYNALDNSTLSSDYITSLVRGEDDKLYAGSWGLGLNALTTNSNKVKIQRIEAASPAYRGTLVNSFISSLLNDSRGFLLIGTEGGLSILNYSTGRFTTLENPDKDTPPLSEIGCMLLDSKGYYWIGTRNGLFRFPASAIRMVNNDEYLLQPIDFYQHQASDSLSIPGNYIVTLLEDSRGAIWLGTYGKGMARVEIDENGRLRSKRYSQDEGLSNNVIYGIQEDHKGNLWFSTDYGLSMLDVEIDQFRNFFKQDGLINNQFYWSASFRSSDGTLYFGGTEGLNYFKPENILAYRQLPDPKITRLRIFNNEVQPGEKFHDQVVLNEPVYVADTILLSYRDNNISFDFSGFDYYLPEKANFAYMMEGIDKDWITVPAQRRFANYSNLAGGTYTFLLKASNGDGIWNNDPSSLTIIITPPFWKTQLFRILLVIFVVTLTFFLIQLQMRRIIQQKRMLEEKVRIRTQQIEEQKIKLEQQASELIEYNHQLERRQTQIENQKQELENKNNEISIQRDELILLNQKVKDVNQQQMKFFTNISHEFRTPLTLIISPVERLIKKFSDDEESSKLIKTINRNAQRLLMLINQLLEIRKVETGNQELQVELTHTEAYLNEIYDSFMVLAQKNNIDYRCELEVNNVSWIDKEKLENVLYNLLSNAFKFTPSGKQVLLKARSFKRNENEFLQIEIADTGIGIASNQLSRLFDRFFQVTDSRNHVNRGTGIGLSLVKSLVEFMYGSIEVKSIPGEGTRFIVTLPANKKFFADHEIDTRGQAFESNIRNKVAVLSEQLKTPANTELLAGDAPIEKILVAEDNNDMRSFICNALAPYFQVLEASNGAEAYQLAKNEDPALIISDIMMPEMDGLELCKRTKNNLYTSHIPLILLTAKGSTNEFIEGLEQGADDYIAKPFNVDILIAKAKAIIENRKKMRSRFSSLDEVPATEITSSKLDHQFFSKVNEVVEQYYTDSSFDVDHFASAMYVSRSQLYKKLKAITNLSANDFINVYRLKKSTELLKKGHLQISEIAYATGFNDPKYFSRIFKKFYKCSPSEFLRKGES